jgi:hypothetical protein
MVFIEGSMIEICRKWHNFIERNKGVIKIEYERVHFGRSLKVCEWDDVGRRNYINHTTLIDMIIMKLFP